MTTYSNKKWSSGESDKPYSLDSDTPNEVINLLTPPLRTYSSSENAETDPLQLAGQNEEIVSLILC